jgi:hypothetical protein
MEENRQEQRAITDLLPKPVYKVRLDNFMTLFEEFKQDHSDEPEHGMLKKFALRIGQGGAYVSQIKNGRRCIGHKLAREIETNLGLPEGYLDMPVSVHGRARTQEEGLAVEAFLRLYRKHPEKARMLLSLFDS